MNIVYLDLNKVLRYFHEQNGLHDHNSYMDSFLTNKQNQMVLVTGFTSTLIGRLRQVPYPDDI